MFITALENTLLAWVSILLVGALIPLFRTKTWWLRSWTYARLQVVSLCLPALVIGLIYLDFNSWKPWYILLAGLVICGICLRDILPFTRLNRPEVKRVLAKDCSHKIKLLTANVLMDNQNYARLLRLIKVQDPDIVFLLETDEDWRAGMAELESDYPYSHLLALPDYNGMLLYSRFPIQNVQERYLVQDHIPSITADIEYAEDQTFKFFGVHPRPPRPEDDIADLDKELKIIAREAKSANGPVIVTGDLNDVGWSTTTKHFLKTSGLLDPRKGRGLYNSFHAQHRFIRWPLDHIFHSPHFKLIGMKRLGEFGSDHFPILITLGLPNEDQ